MTMPEWLTPKMMTGIGATVVVIAIIATLGVTEFAGSTGNYQCVVAAAETCTVECTSTTLRGGPTITIEKTTEGGCTASVQHNAGFEAVSRFLQSQQQ